MSRLRDILERYVQMRQGLGYKYEGPARRLSDFVSFMEASDIETITTALAMEWVTRIGRQPTWAGRLTDVRCLAQHVAHFDPATQVPPADAVPARRRTKPYIYTDAEIEALLAAALSLPPTNALRRWTYHSLFGLITVAGLHHSEPLNLHRDDVDLDQGGRLLHQYAHRVFWRLSRQIGLRQKGQRDGPRIHDLRHRFAVQTLINWYRVGEDIEQQSPVLSTFLGHVGVRDSYWYLSTTPELMSYTARMLEQRWEART